MEGNMFALSIGLTYENTLDLNRAYRYDFVVQKSKYDFGGTDLRETVFVFRTILEGQYKGNVLVDCVKCININGVDVARHGNCHFYFFPELSRISWDSKDEAIEEMKINDNAFIYFQVEADSLSVYARIENQKIGVFDRYSTNGINGKINEINNQQIKIILFRLYNEDVINGETAELSKIFKLELEHIWHNNRWQNFNNIHKLDFDRSSKDNNEDITWKEVKEIIKEKKDEWHVKSSVKFDELLEEISSYRYRILE